VKHDKEFVPSPKRPKKAKSKKKGKGASGSGLKVELVEPTVDETADAQMDVDEDQDEKSNKGKRDVVFTWMDADKWASWLKNMYGIKGKEGPVIVIADHSSYLYYDKDQQDETIKLTSPSIFATIDGIIHGSITPKHSENFAERLSRSLNAKLTSLEAFVINKPLQTISIVVIVLVLVFLAAKRAIADDVADLRQDRHTKSRRLD